MAEQILWHPFQCDVFRKHGLNPVDFTRGALTWKQVKTMWRHGMSHRDLQPPRAISKSVPPVCLREEVSCFRARRCRQEKLLGVRLLSRSNAADVSLKMRSILLEWLLEVWWKFKFQLETLFLTINILDRVLAQDTLLVTRPTLQLVGVTSMWIASKVEEKAVPECADMRFLCADSYTTSQIKKAEVNVCKALGWTFHHPTLFHFAHFLVSSPTLQRADQEAVRLYTWRTCILATFHTEILHAFYPPVVAIAAFQSAVSKLGTKRYTTITLRAQTLWKVSSDALTECKRTMARCFQVRCSKEVVAFFAKDSWLPRTS